ncbi:acid protease [Ceratobasidium sp. AG-I]|nr:acid protease [Ceratobasidium sp. AG-I]
MFTPATSTALLALAGSAFAAQSVQLTRNIRSVASMRGISNKDRTRAKSFAEAATLPGVVPAVNEDVTYSVEVKIGSQTFNLIVDTGSSNTWVGAGSPYNPGPTSVNDGRAVSIGYGSGFVYGVEYRDTISLGSLTGKNQSLSVSSYSQGFDGFDGIIGFGPESLTKGTVGGSYELIPTVMQTLVNDGAIDQNVLGVYFQPVTGSSKSEANGELSIGGPDSSRYTGDITYVNITTTQPYSAYWGIDVDALSYDGANQTALIQAASAIVDTGTTLTYIPTPAMKAFLAATDGVLDHSTTLASFQTKPTANITLTISGTAFTLSPDQYLVPEGQYDLFGLNSTSYYAWFTDGGEFGSVNFIIGQKVLEHLYSVYDTTNRRVGFAYAVPKDAQAGTGGVSTASPSSSPTLSVSATSGSVTATYAQATASTTSTPSSAGMSIVPGSQVLAAVAMVLFYFNM